jgi:hypothetical protein
MSTTYHPQTDGKIEVINKCLEKYLRCFSSKNPNQWAQWIPLAKWWYNTTYRGATKMTPYEVFYGPPKPLSVASYVLGTSNIFAVDKTLHIIESIIHILKENLVMVQNRMKQQDDQHRY